MGKTNHGNKELAFPVRCSREEQVEAGGGGGTPINFGSSKQKLIPYLRPKCEKLSPMQGKNKN